MFNDPNPNPNRNFFSCVAGWFRKQHSITTSLSLLCHHLLCCALNNFASPSPTPLCVHPLHCALTYSAVPSPSLLCRYPLYSAPTYFTILSPPPTLCALTYSTLLCSYLVLLPALTQYSTVLSPTPPCSYLLSVIIYSTVMSPTLHCSNLLNTALHSSKLLFMALTYSTLL